MKANANLSYLTHDHDRQYAGTKSSAAPSRSVSTRYTCPMYPEIVRDAPGRCPKCSMTLTPILDAAQRGTENFCVMRAAARRLQPESYLECGITQIPVAGPRAVPNCVTSSATYGSVSRQHLRRWSAHGTDDLR
jgi:hypothetical protein